MRQSIDQLPYAYDIDVVRLASYRDYMWHCYIGLVDGLLIGPFLPPDFNDDTELEIEAMMRRRWRKWKHECENASAE